MIKLGDELELPGEARPRPAIDQRLVDDATSPQFEAMAARIASTVTFVRNSISALPTCSVL